MNEVTISVTIAGKPLKLRVDKNEEVIIRKAVELIEKNLSEFTLQSGSVDKQTLLSMIALQNTAKMLKLENNSVGTDENILKRLTEFDQLLSDVLANEITSN